jgi:hypothetical protein
MDEKVKPVASVRVTSLAAGIIAEMPLNPSIVIPMIYPYINNPCST